VSWEAAGKDHTHPQSFFRSTPRVWRLCVIASDSVALAACGGPSVEVGDAAPDPIPDAQVRADEARARLMASEGGQMVLDVIEKHGGLEAWHAAPTSAYSWEYSNFGSQRRFKTSLVADNTTRRIYHRIMTLGTPDAVEEIDGRMAWDGQDAWVSPASIDQIDPRFWAATGYYFESIPFVLADPGSTSRCSRRRNTTASPMTGSRPTRIPALAIRRVTPTRCSSIQRPACWM
jgi:hypothetical protein